jgi:hypothetical protein
MNWKFPMALAGVVPVIALALAPSAAVAHDGGDNVIRGHLTASMPTDDAINGVNPGTRPWIIDRGEVRVRESGRMDVRIEGLQIPAGFFDPNVDFNPVANIHAVLYCDGSTTPSADSGSQPMTVPGGDSRFRVHVMAPKMCDMPSVLIQPDAGGAPAPAYIASLVAMDDDD